MQMWTAEMLFWNWDENIMAPLFGHDIRMTMAKKFVFWSEGQPLRLGKPIIVRGLVTDEEALPTWLLGEVTSCVMITYELICFTEWLNYVGMYLPGQWDSGVFFLICNVASSDERDFMTAKLLQGQTLIISIESNSEQLRMRLWHLTLFVRSIELATCCYEMTSVDGRWIARTRTAHMLPSNSSSLRLDTPMALRWIDTINSSPGEKRARVACCFCVCTKQRGATCLHSTQILHRLFVGRTGLLTTGLRAYAMIIIMATPHNIQ